MNFAVILAGGVGTRMGMSVPKQYIFVEDKPVLVYTLEQFMRCPDIDKIAIVADPVWRDTICEWIDQYHIEKFLGFADPGDTRQDSIFSGLTLCKAHAEGERDTVVVHDAVRAAVTAQLISETVRGLDGYDGCMPVLPLKDAVFFSSDGNKVESLMDRNKLFAAQTPECFYLLPYWEINHRTPPEERAKVLGNYELAFQNGWSVHPIAGDENNFKLTTPADIDRMVSLLRVRKQ